MTMTRTDVQSRLIRPLVDPDSADWWEGLRVGQIRLPRCQSCSRTWFPPSSGCPFCGGTRWETVLCSGRGRLYSWVIVHRSLDPEYAQDVPYVIGTVRLEEGPKVFARIVDTRLDALRPELELEAMFYEVDGIHLLGFQAHKAR